MNSPILVVGRTGQLALSLAERAAARGLQMAFVGRAELDLLEPTAIRRSILERRPSLVVNAAAYTAVDRAEDEPALARSVNASASRLVAEAAREVGARLIHISTDYVFDGSGDRPWREDDLPRPLGVYGRTKLEGEDAVRETLSDHVILRTSWVYSPFGRNFVKTMLCAAQTQPQLRVVGDQVGNPTCALDLADGILTMIDAWHEEPARGSGGTYHVAGTGSASWAEFAREIFALSRSRGGPAADVEAIATADWPARAERPLNSRLDSSRFAETFACRLPSWRQSLPEVVARLIGGE